MTRAVHVVGAGLAGLAAALRLADAGRAVTLHEAGPAAGGRCRSYWDRELGCRLDNGNHLLLSGNDAVWAYVDRIGSRGTFTGPSRPLVPFMDLATDERWAVAPNLGRVPWWVLRDRVPGTYLSEYLDLLALRRAGPQATVAGTLRHRTLFHRLLEPLAIAGLNTMTDTGSARLLAAIVDGTLGRGGRACIPALPREGLSESLIDPAVAAIEAKGGQVLTGSRVQGLVLEGGRASALRTPAGQVPLGPDDAIVLAVPCTGAAALLPGLVVPDAFESILNLHYRAEASPPGAVGEAGLVGLVGGFSEWVFVKPGVLSVTVSAANRYQDETPDTLAARAWPEVCRAVGLPPQPMPPHRVVREKRATFAATPAQDARRPGPRTAWGNVALAGDWTATGLPATIEGAIRSGNTAAEILLA